MRKLEDYLSEVESGIDSITGTLESTIDYLKQFSENSSQEDLHDAVEEVVYDLDTLLKEIK